MGKTLSQAEVEQLYADNAAHEARLAALTNIDVADVIALHRHVRFFVASELWARLTQAGRTALLNDGHPHVRSAAEISHRGDVPVSVAVL
ncbi:MAG: hypothetical protein F8N36_12055 [Desulfovibrio sp.]|uniref:hypothetical protein n=1 Tax=Desulfovibrio sp. TaxID=885 RepID=UPI00135D7BA2|nr:hypothetical protein [Desulfovibrio sp.]MTJ93581.1 hypothetical protein [Desulfovibrio sp.]